MIVWLGDSFFLRLSTFPADLPAGVYPATFLGFFSGNSHFLVQVRPCGSQSGATPQRPDVRRSLQVCKAPSVSRLHLFYLGLALSTASLFSLALWVMICIFYHYLASYEEKLLKARFGESYRNYKEKTGKWMPRMLCIY